MRAYLTVENMKLNYKSLIISEKTVSIFMLKKYIKRKYVMRNYLSVN